MRHFVMAAIVLCVGVAGVSQPAGPLMQCTFDADTDGWSCTKPNEQPAQVRDEQVTREGGGVLEHSYIAQPGDLSALAVSTPRGLPGGKSVRFWLKTTEIGRASCRERV